MQKFAYPDVFGTRNIELKINSNYSDFLSILMTYLLSEQRTANKFSGRYGLTDWKPIYSFTSLLKIISREV